MTFDNEKHADENHSSPTFMRDQDRAGAPADRINPVTKVSRRAQMQLVCEGRCNNGMTKEFDDAVRNHGRSEATRSGGRIVSVTNVPGYLLDHARTFVHTPHVVHHGEGTAACLNCGTIRRWGNRTF